MTMKPSTIQVQTRLKLAKAIAWLICVITLVSGLGVCIWIETRDDGVDQNHDAPQTSKLAIDQRQPQDSSKASDR